jgi:hypothetical protein
MPIQKTRNENFFKVWTPEMAYVLGFFAADGSMYKTQRGTHYIEFQITDGDLLLKIRQALGSSHKITERKPQEMNHKKIYRLQVGSKIIFSDLVALGFWQNKSLTVRVPSVPEAYFCDFLRGYFDGDGNIMFGYYRRPGRAYSNRIVSTRFISGSRLFLNDIKNILIPIVANGSLFFASGAWRLNYGIHDSEKLFQYMYHHGDVEGLIYLDIKYKIFQKATNAVVAQFG